MYLVPDSNVLFMDFMLAGAQWHLVRDQARRGQLTIAVPEVVVAETVNNYRRELKSAHSKLRNAVETHGGRLIELGITDVSLDTEIDRNANVDTYEALLRTKLVERGSEILEIPNLPHSEIVERAIARRQPFKDQDSGYRDTLIWTNVLTLAEQAEVALVSNDQKAFAGDTSYELGEALLADLGVRKLQPDRVKLYPNLTPFIEVQVPRNERILHELQERLRTNAGFLELLRREVESVVSLYSFGNQDEIRLPTGADQRAASIEEVTVPDLWVDAVLGPEEGTVVVDIGAEAYGHVEFPVSREALRASAEAEDLVVLDREHDDLHALVSSPLSFTAQVVAAYDPETNDLNEFEVVFAST